MVSDNDIIQAIGENAEKGFRLFLATYKEPIYWHVRRLVVSHDDAEDATQETFVRIFRNFTQHSQSQSFKAWVYRIATNEALRMLGKQKKGSVLSLEDSTYEMLSAKTDEHFDDSDTIVALLQKAILFLPTKQQLVFNMRYYDDICPTTKSLPFSILR